MLLAAVRVGRDRLQAGAIGGAEVEVDAGAHVAPCYSAAIAGIL